MIMMIFSKLSQYSTYVDSKHAMDTLEGGVVFAVPRHMRGQL